MLLLLFTNIRHNIWLLSLGIIRIQKQPDATKTIGIRLHFHSYSLRFKLFFIKLTVRLCECTHIHFERYVCISNVCLDWLCINYVFIYLFSIRIKWLHFNIQFIEYTCIFLFLFLIDRLSYIYSYKIIHLTWYINVYVKTSTSILQLMNWCERSDIKCAHRIQKVTLHTTYHTKNYRIKNQTLWYLTFCSNFSIFTKIPKLILLWIIGFSIP